MIPPALLRRLPLAAALTAIGLAAAGCGGGDDDATTTTAKAAAGSGFPVTIEHRYGKAVIDAAPQRVVALSHGSGDLDALVAVGITPVGTSRDDLNPSGIPPWLTGKVDPKTTELLPFSSGVNFEKVAALRPDLISATGNAGSGTDFERLSGIAPTIAYRDSWFRQTWQEQTLLVGRAVGREQRAKQAVARTEATLRDVLRRHPGLKGRTFTLSSGFEPGKIVTIRDPKEVVARLFGQIGLRLAPGAQKVPKFSADNDGGAVSLENLDALDADVMIVSYVNPQIQRATERNPLFRRIAAVREGRYLAVDQETITQLRVPSVLGIPWALKRIEPVLAKAAG
ncbi:iron-siderophore ABC transporter substrate-binding protein [Patulibacter defluvii]|uniref:iron-siderophore ABC transporter substrate-binding protein n=1 Tax=Patulibacter defluvii TaxID=3095358 RepID=UPI002A75BD7B|nr:iron-siderophore ABC transporter substrate-binding protein [Patulibacter sp. DM4]